MAWIQGSELLPCGPEAMSLMMTWSKSSWSWKEDDWNSPPRRRSHVRKLRPSSSPPRKKSKGKGKGKNKSARGWWEWIPQKPAPWYDKDDKCSEPIEVADDDDDDDEDDP